MKIHPTFCMLLTIGSFAAQAMDGGRAIIEQILRGDYGRAHLICNADDGSAKTILADRPGCRVSLRDAGIGQICCGPFVALCWQTGPGWFTQLLKTKSSLFFTCGSRFPLSDEKMEQTVEIKNVYAQQPGRCLALARDGTMLIEAATPEKTVLATVNLTNEQHIQICTTKNQPLRTYGDISRAGLCNTFELYVGQRLSKRIEGNIFYTWDFRDGLFLLFIDYNHELTFKPCFELASGQPIPTPAFWNPARHANE